MFVIQVVSCFISDAIIHISRGEGAAMTSEGDVGGETWLDGMYPVGMMSGTVRQFSIRG